MLQDLLQGGTNLRVCGELEHTPVEDIDIVLTHDCGERGRWPGRVKMVFVRDPLESIASWYVLDMTEGVEDTKMAFSEFAFQRAIPYWLAFVQEYVVYNSRVEPHCNVFGYRNFLFKPERGLLTIGQILGVEIDIATALQKTPVKLQSDHSTFKHYKDLPLVQEMKRQLGPYPALLQQRGLI